MKKIAKKFGSFGIFFVTLYLDREHERMFLLGSTERA